MTTPRQRLTFAAGVLLAGLTLSFLAGMVTDRIRHDRQRNAVLSRYEHALERWHGELMALEPRPSR